MYITYAKASIEASFLTVLDAMKTQYGVTVAVCHLNDTVLFNRTTRISLEKRGTVSETSTPYNQQQNGVADFSNRLAEGRARSLKVAAPHVPKTIQGTFS
jgi:transcriptional regulator of nitric oxide reductase